MAQDVRRRQKKLARQKAKKKEKRTALVHRSQRGLATVFERVADAPIIHACAADVLFDQGIGNVLLTRELPDGRVAFSMFLVDMYCLGVKDAMWNVITRGEYERGFFAQVSAKCEFISFSAESTRKLVEGAVDYAARFDLKPHADYRTAKLIFSGIDSNDSADEFEYGKNGEPYFFAGPHDTPQRCAGIIAALTEHCGADGFKYVLPMGGSGAFMEN